MRWNSCEKGREHHQVAHWKSPRTNPCRIQTRQSTDNPEVNLSWTQTRCIMTDKDLLERNILKAGFPKPNVSIRAFRTLTRHTEITRAKLGTTAAERGNASQLQIKDKTFGRSQPGFPLLPRLATSFGKKAYISAVSLGLSHLWKRSRSGFETLGILKYISGWSFLLSTSSFKESSTRYQINFRKMKNSCLPQHHLLF